MGCLLPDVVDVLLGLEGHEAPDVGGGVGVHLAANLVRHADDAQVLTRLLAHHLEVPARLDVGKHVASLHKELYNPNENSL